MLEAIEALNTIGTGPGTLQFSRALPEATEFDGYATVSVVRAGGVDGVVTVDYATTNGGTAESGVDFTAVSGALTFVGTDSFTYTVIDGPGGSAVATVTITVLPANAGCELYPIALYAGTVANAQPGDILSDILNGGQAGNFGWLTWTGNNSTPSLIASLTPPGNSAHRKICFPVGALVMCRCCECGK